MQSHRWLFLGGIFFLGFVAGGIWFRSDEKPKTQPTQTAPLAAPTVERWYVYDGSDWQKPMRITNLNYGDVIVLDLSRLPPVSGWFCATYNMSQNLLLKVLGWRNGNTAFPQWQVIHGSGDFIVTLYPAPPEQIRNCPWHPQFR